MKYVILIHSQPRAVGPPDLANSPPRAGGAGRAAREMRARVRGAAGRRSRRRGSSSPPRRWATRRRSTIYGWSPEGHLATDGPYAEAKEQLAGYFMIDAETRERAEEIAAQFAQPGGMIELRPAMWPGGGDE